MTSAPTGLLDASGCPLFVGFPWAGVARILDRGWGLDDLRAHQLQLLETARLRERGLPLPPGLEEEARRAQLTNLVARTLLERVREVCSGPILVLKGAEVATWYPAPGLRPFVDVDVLVPDARAVEHQLRSVGFRSVGPEQDWGALHHLQRLAAPDLPMTIEVHRRPKWVDGVADPPLDDLFGSAVPSATGIDGLLAPAPALHAVLLAAHAWAERPLGRIGDLVDVSVMAGSRGDAAEFAHRYGLERIWRTTITAADGLFDDRRTTWPLRVCARHLPRVREKTVLESHLERILAPFWGLPLRRALRASARGVAHTVKPTPNERWRAKLARSRRAIRNAFVRRSQHEHDLRDDREDER